MKRFFFYRAKKNATKILIKVCLHLQNVRVAMPHPILNEQITKVHHYQCVIKVLSLQFYHTYLRFFQV